MLLRPSRLETVKMRSPNWNLVSNFGMMVCSSRGIHDFVCGALLGIEHEFNSQFLEEEAVLGGEIVFVVDPGHHFLRSQLLCEQGAHDVDFLRGEGIHGDEKVGAGHSGVAQGLYGRRAAKKGLHVGIAGQGAQAHRVVVDHRDFIGFFAKHLGKVGADFAGAFNDYLHIVSSIRIYHRL